MAEALTVGAHRHNRCLVRGAATQGAPSGGQGRGSSSGRGDARAMRDSLQGQNYPKQMPRVGPDPRRIHELPREDGSRWEHVKEGLAWPGRFASSRKLRTGVEVEGWWVLGPPPLRGKAAGQWK